MKPIATDRVTTYFNCGDCGKEHLDRSRAETCCACCTCSGPTTADDKKIARGGSISGYYRSELTCEWCRVRKEVKAKQDQVRRQESEVEQAKKRLAATEHELRRRQAELETLVAKRDALPPKPRLKKEEDAP